MQRSGCSETGANARQGRDGMRIFGMLLVTVGTAIIVLGFLTARTVAQVPTGDPGGEFMWAVLVGGPLAALGLIIVAIRKPEKKMPKGDA